MKIKELLVIIITYIIGRYTVRKNNDNYDWLDVRVIMMLSILWIITSPILLSMYMWDIASNKLSNTKPPKWL